MVTKKNRSIENAVDKRTEFAEKFRKNCNAQGIQIHSTLSETKASFNERKIRSLKNPLHLHGKLWVHVKSQFPAKWHNVKF